MKKLITIFLTAAMLLGSCMLFPVSAETATSLDNKLVVHYDFDHTDSINDQTCALDTAVAGTSKDTLKLDSNASIQDGYLYVDSVTTSYTPPIISCLGQGNSSDSGYDVEYNSTGKMTVMMDFQLENLVGGMSNIFNLGGAVRCFVSRSSYTSATSLNTLGLRIGSSSDKSMYLSYWNNGERTGYQKNSGVIQTLTNESDMRMNESGANSFAAASCNKVGTSRVKYALTLDYCTVTDGYNADTGEYDKETKAVYFTSYYSYDGGKSWTAARMCRLEGISDTFFENISGVYLGPQYNSGTDRKGDMDIYDFRIYNDVLDADDLVSICAEENEVHYVGYQNSAKAYKVNESDTTYVYDTRLIATIDSKDYVKAGFKVYDGDYTLSSEVTHCFTSIMAQDAYGEKYTVEAPNNRYYIALTISEIPMGTNPTFTVIPWVELDNGTVLHYDAVTVTVDEAQIN